MPAKTTLPSRHPLRCACWIWPSYQHTHNTYVQFRHDFDLAALPTHAPLFITADQSYVLYVNGSYAGRGPARGYQQSWPFDEIDIGPLLRPGHNWLSVIVYNAGISTYQYIHAGVAGLLCAATWGNFNLASDASWLCRPDTAHRADTARTSRQTNFQEHVDTRLDDGKWITSARPPRGWSAPGKIQAFGSMPWHDVEPRGIPNLDNDILGYARTCTQAAGKCGPGWQGWPNLTRGFYDECRLARWRPAAAGRPSPGGLSLNLPPTGAGRFHAVSMDLGTLGVGTLIVRADGSAGGETIDFYFCEMLDDDGRPVVPPEGCASNASMSARLILRPGRTQYEFYQLMGHRYLVAIARSTRRPIRLKLALRHCVYPMDVRGRFSSSDPTLNAIHAICVRTQQVCALDAYVDTPWREQAQWWGDARVQAQNTFHLSADTRLLIRGIRSIARQEVPNGLTYGNAPTCGHHAILPDFSMIWALTIWDCYWQTGDASIAAEQWPRIERLLNYFESDAPRQQGLLADDRRYWLFLDWSDIHKQGVPAILNLWYVITLDKLVTLAGVIGMKLRQSQLQALRSRLARQIVRLLWNQPAGLFRDGCTPDGRPVNTHSIHTQTLAILAGLKVANHADMIHRVLLPYLRGQAVKGSQPSSYWVTYVYDVMEAAGFGRDVAQHIRTNWAPMLPYGGAWETFSKSELGVAYSVSHAWAAHPIYHLARTLGGIRQADVAWRQIVFQPMLELTDSAETTIPTPRGLIRSTWTRRAGKLDISLKLPRGVTAKVLLPDQPPQTIAASRKWQL